MSALATQQKGKVKTTMKISGLIAELEKVKAGFGDLEVYKEIAPYFEPVLEVCPDWTEGDDALTRVLAL